MHMHSLLWHADTIGGKAPCTEGVCPCTRDPLHSPTLVVAKPRALRVHALALADTVGGKPLALRAHAEAHAWTYVRAHTRTHTCARACACSQINGRPSQDDGQDHRSDISLQVTPHA